MVILLNLKEWKELIQDFINHAINRYGLESVKNWMFIPWIMPDSSPVQFGFEDDNEFYKGMKLMLSNQNLRREYAEKAVLKSKDLF